MGLYNSCNSICKEYCKGYIFKYEKYKYKMEVNEVSL